MNIHSEIQPLLQNIQHLTFERYIDNSTIKEKNKKYYKNLFKKYMKFCNDKYLMNNIVSKNECPLDANINIYDTSNVLEFIKQKCSFKRTSIHKILNVFLIALNKCTRNPNLEYPSSLGQILKPYNKYYIQLDGLKYFMNYLKRKEDFQTFVIFELLYKFGIRVGAISKIKVMDINEEGVIIFHEKNQKKPKRNLSEKFYQKIKYLISINKLKERDFLFFNNYKNKSEKRGKLLARICFAQHIQLKPFKKMGLSRRQKN